jgi:sterol desaturase/sphingolipid hydroxylase (fatty acid hydroxylase superfamily)
MNTQELIITWATPVFFLLIGIELLVAKLRGRDAYASNDAINSIGLGAISQLVAVFAKLLTIGIYAWCAGHLALFRLPADSVAVWIGALLAYDFCYYWLHRMGHEVNILWAAHVVHHQSERYNLSTALRQPWSPFLVVWVFAPMPLLGYPTAITRKAGQLNLLYQYWIHTDAIRSIGPGEEVLNTPSHHRVHHGSNRGYLDRNHGSILILWDRLFGTFQREEEPVVYGLTKNIGTYSPAVIATHEHRDMLRDVADATTWRERLSFVLRGPGWAYERHAARAAAGVS